MKRTELTDLRRAVGWGLSPRAKAAAAQLLEETVEDTQVPLVIRLSAVETMLRMGALELAEDRAAAAVDNEQRATGATVFVLPSNGTEAAGGDPPAAIGFQDVGDGIQDCSTS